MPVNIIDTIGNKIVTLEEGITLEHVLGALAYQKRERERKKQYKKAYTPTGNPRGRPPKEKKDIPHRDRKSTRLNSSHSQQSRMPSSA